MAWFKRSAPPPPTTGPGASALWASCPSCSRVLHDDDLAANLHVCPGCAHHLHLNAAGRLRALLDDGRWREHDAGLVSTDPLTFADRTPYPDRLQVGMAATGLRDAVITATGAIGGVTVEAAAMDFGFIGGTLGVVVGEKITRAAERSLRHGRPLVVVCVSSGTRLMEGTLALMQLAKVSTALARLDRARVPHLCVLTDPTTGGVTASFAMLADVTIAEPGARIGFTAPHVIGRTTGGRLPGGFQRSEYLLAHGMVDMVVDRRALKGMVARLLGFLGASPAVAEPSGASTPAPPEDAPAARLDLPLD